MAYSDWFRTSGRGRGYDATIYIHARNPAELATGAEVSYWDRQAADKIATLEAQIAALREYRQELAVRYAYLETAPYTRRLELTREKRWSGKVYYHLRIVRTFEDGAVCDELQEHFEGSARHEALKRYDALRKQFPGIEAVKDIAKKQWEH